MAKFRKLPLHPQWLLELSGAESALQSAFAGLQGRVLDIGCADRRFAARLPAGCTYIGIDYPDTAVSMYQTRPDIFADARGLPFPSGSMQGVILKDVLEHVPDPKSVLMEISRVLSDGGVLVLWMPFIYPIHDAPFDFQRYTEHGLRRYLADQGLRVTDFKGVLSPIETASLMTCLALGDSAEQILLRRRWLLPLVPFLGALVLLINVAGKGLSWLPATGFMPSSYRLVAIRDKSSG
ncbi:MAG TPA: class I SAM-dependent methyltransferase [Gammaproteobacteria bacterium]|nr:class I SAM-dependent methyltransferase [Gammaproteobacteria bacterium]